MCWFCFFFFLLFNNYCKVWWRNFKVLPVAVSTYIRRRKKMFCVIILDFWLSFFLSLHFCFCVLQMCLCCRSMRSYRWNMPFIQCWFSYGGGCCWIDVLDASIAQRIRGCLMNGRCERGQWRCCWIFLKHIGHYMGRWYSNRDVIVFTLLTLACVFCMVTTNSHTMVGHFNFISFRGISTKRAINLMNNYWKFLQCLSDNMVNNILN